MNKKAFVFTLDLVIAIILLIAFLEIAKVVPYTGETYFEKINLKNLSNDIVSSLEKSGFIVETLQDPLKDNETKMKDIYNEIGKFVPSDLNYRIEMKKFTVKEGCTPQKKFDKCFQEDSQFGDCPEECPDLPEDGTTEISHERVVLLKKEIPGVCEREGELAGEQEKAENWLQKFFEKKLFKGFDEAIYFQGQGEFEQEQSGVCDPVSGKCFTITFSVGTDKSELTCAHDPSNPNEENEKIKVDLSLDIQLFGRKPAEVVLVNDESDSMDTFDMEKDVLDSGNLSGGEFTTKTECTGFQFWDGPKILHISEEIDDKVDNDQYDSVSFTITNLTQYKNNGGQCNVPRIKIESPTGKVFEQESNSWPYVLVPGNEFMAGNWKIWVWSDVAFDYSIRLTINKEWEVLDTPSFDGGTCEGEGEECHAYDNWQHLKEHTISDINMLAVYYALREFDEGSYTGKCIHQETRIKKQGSDEYYESFDPDYGETSFGSDNKWITKVKVPGSWSYVFGAENPLLGTYEIEGWSDSLSQYNLYFIHYIFAGEYLSDTASGNGLAATLDVCDEPIQDTAVELTTLNIPPELHLLGLKFNLLYENYNGACGTPMLYVTSPSGSAECTTVKNNVDTVSVICNGTPENPIELGDWTIFGWSDYPINYDLNWQIQRLDAVKIVGKEFLDFALWDPVDEVGIVSYSNEARERSSLVSVTENRDDLKNALNQMDHDGATAIGDGIQKATDILLEGDAQDMKFQILLTDGHNNAGDTNPIAAAQNAASNDITIYTIGFGADHDAELLQQIAEITGGSYYSADDEDALSDVYNLIATKIGDSLEGEVDGLYDVKIRVPLHDGTTFHYAMECGALKEEGKNEIIFNVGNLVTSGQWSDCYYVSFPCNNDAACNDNYPPDGKVNHYYKKFPQPETYMYYNFEEERGQEPQHNILFNAEVGIPFNYRDLRVEFVNGKVLGNNQVEFTVRVSNDGYLSSYKENENGIIRLQYLWESPGQGYVDLDPNNPFLVPTEKTFYCGDLDDECDKEANPSSEDIKRNFQKEGKFIINLNTLPEENTLTPDCPQYNTISFYCGGGTETAYYVLDLWLWQK